MSSMSTVQRSRWRRRLEKMRYSVREDLIRRSLILDENAAGMIRCMQMQYRAEWDLGCFVCVWNEGCD
jgi:hypothetical protein